MRGLDVVRKLLALDGTLFLFYEPPSLAGCEPTIITKHGKPAAMVVPIDKARKLYPDRDDAFVDFLLTYPGGIELEQNQSKLRDYGF
ncbi:type II toxin-antitoxin system Phd/YefM family antitoxin [Allomesorhizobium camelthorni]|uniref:Type II toxin-antitoxin system prevent-host-death family antitoxin n=1 Tax=Allomesorhizobium camelthorni TaxID=475069 RepID=A0A6G4W599_9HYPH|nr:type II toxin-antitoxin system prevent-host-death family antitoxin [Mesorhizobium camelthorni]NGO49714.1 type II toxin-antitoxin system prevent-host-death family antitoxin [Mesorhizobium camelthorni]